MEIRTLEEWSDWFMWKQDVTTALMLQGWESLLKRDTKPPRKLEAWEDCQRQAVAIVRSSIGYRNLDLVKGMTTVLEIVDAIDTWFQGYKTTVFLVLSHEYESLTLEGCTDVAEYVDKLLTVRAKLEQLDESCKIGQAHFINKFLTGLGGNYETFLIIFNMNHSLIPEYKDGKIIKRGVTFSEAVEAARQYELIHKPRRANLGVISMRSRETCSNCHKPGHQQEGCWFLHPELRTEASKRRRRRMQTRMQ
ncbi:hypothetical protein A0O28_0106740 [Trichoderma guizhouense]|uniref:CCHC-type domain-containing protein n=1 Tax=Trichoderma guizhouense TaxID=1491466 RepID=A0A1T3CIQ2_9HYPO|nr:hypothetical protein A0O28_0106740 [Trichoderma guizhouense]